MTDEKISVLFVCMGNICRSPTAEGVFRSLVEQEGLSDRVTIESAGTHAYHVGEPPDARAQQAAKRRGYDLSAQRARRVAKGDCEKFDYLLAMDTQNLERLEELCPNAEPRRFLEFAQDASVRDVPDPYYGGGDGFERVLDLIEDAARGLLAEIRERLAVERA